MGKYWSSRRFLEEFPRKGWFRSSLHRLVTKSDTGNGLPTNRIIGRGCRRLVKPNAQRKSELNTKYSTELDWIVQLSYDTILCKFSSVQFSSVFRCALNQRRAGRRRPSSVVAGFRPTTDTASIGRSTRMYPDCEEPVTTANFVAESSPVQCTAGNLTVPLSSVSRCALGSRTTANVARVEELICSHGVAPSSVLRFH